MQTAKQEDEDTKPCKKHGKRMTKSKRKQKAESKSAKQEEDKKQNKT